MLSGTKLPSPLSPSSLPTLAISSFSSSGATAQMGKRQQQRVRWLAAVVQMGKESDGANGVKAVRGSGDGRAGVVGGDAGEMGRRAGHASAIAAAQIGKKASNYTCQAAPSFPPSTTPTRRRRHSRPRRTYTRSPTGGSVEFTNRRRLSDS